MYQFKKLTNFAPFVAIKNAFTSEELEKVRALMHENMNAAKIGSDSKDNPAHFNQDIRRSKTRFLYSQTIEHDWLFSKLAAQVSEANDRAFGLDIFGIETIQLTEYDESDKGCYGAHCDCGYGEITPISFRKLSISVQLTPPDEYDGGDLKLYSDNFNAHHAPRELGTMILFRSHIIHEVTPVTKGKRLSLVAWVHGPLPR